MSEIDPNLTTILDALTAIVRSAATERLSHYDTYQLLLFICHRTDVQFGELDRLVSVFDEVGDLVLAQEESTPEQAYAVVEFAAADGRVGDSDAEADAFISAACDRVMARRGAYFCRAGSPAFAESRLSSMGTS